MDSREISLQALSLSPGGEWHNASDGWGLLYLQRGEGRFSWGSAMHVLRSGEALLFPAGVNGVLKPDSGSEIAGVQMKFFPDHLGGFLTFAERLLFRRADGRPDCIRRLPAHSKLVLRLCGLSRNGSPWNSLEHRCELLRLFAPLVLELQLMLEELPDGNSEACGRLVDVLGQLSDADLLGLSVDQLAHRCGISRRHLNRLVNEQFGCSIQSLKAQVRLERAALLLHDPNAKIISVALDCGFNHLGSFTAQFRERFGSTPAKWRRALFAAAETASQNERDKAVGPQVESGRMRERDTNWDALRPTRAVQRVLASNRTRFRNESSAHPA